MNACDPVPAWALASRTTLMRPSAVRDILKLTQQGGVLSLAGGLPAPEGFPSEALERASQGVWRHRARAALQYGPSDGVPALREWVAGRCRRRGWEVSPEQVIITSGSQQGLDLVGRVLIEPGETVLMEQPTYLGALQSFAPWAPRVQPWAADAEGPLPAALQPGQRLAYLVPSYQNPTGRCVGAARRGALVAAARAARVPLIEDDPYGGLWYDDPPPLPMASIGPDDVIHLGSWSKVLAPGLRLGYVICPAHRVDGIGRLLVRAREGADLHSSSLSQHLVLQLLEDGFDLDAHLDGVRSRYRAQRDAMDAALKRHMPAGWHWTRPAGGMFFWVQGSEGCDTAACLPSAIDAGVAFVPGSAFQVPGTDAVGVGDCMRLSFVTLDPAELDEAVRRLAGVLRGARGG